MLTNEEISERNGLLIELIKELDLELIPPCTQRMDEPEYGGSKIVIVGKPGCFIKNTKGELRWSSPFLSLDTSVTFR